ncbi:MAG: M4 family metallopeptidase [Polyangiaceae bacterium]
MKRTSFGLFLLLSSAVLGVTACAAPGDSDPPAGPGGADPQADPAAERLESGSLQSDSIQEAIQKHDAAKAQMKAHPEFDAAVRSFNERRAEHGVGDDDTFRIRRVNTDETGAKHVQLDHFYKGVRVLKSTGVLSADKDSVVQREEASHLRRGIAIDTTPTFPLEQAKRVIAAHPKRGATPLVEPRAELVIYPVEKRFVIATGAEVTGQETDLNALDVERRVVEYRLAHQIDTVDASRGGPPVSNRFFVDAKTGEVLKAQSKSHDSRVKGSGWTYRNDGPNNDYHPPLWTEQHNATNFEPWDSYRNFGVWDDDYGNNSGPNWDMNNLWGDGAAFAGDANATFQNRQTAIADAGFALQGTWDMMDHVWNIRGYNNDFYEGDAYVHVDTEWDNASYNDFTGNISVGDAAGSRSSVRTDENALSHEFGHGFNDFHRDINGNGESDGINEGIGDIFSEIFEAYEKGGGLAAGSISIPLSPGPDWHVYSCGRDLDTPSYPYWTSDLENWEEHNAGQPFGHMFYYLTKGASNDPGSALFSPYIRWSMTGIGIDKSARIFMRAIMLGFNGDQGYADARQSFLDAASQLYGYNGTEYKTVQNAFAAINVGSTMSGYPGPAVSTNESESNNTTGTATAIADGVLPAGAPLTGTVAKRTMLYGGVGTADTVDYYWISVPSGKTLRATMFPLNDADISILDASNVAMDSSTGSGTAMEQVVTKAPADGVSHLYRIKIWHFATALGQIPWYQTYVDLY